jgi:tetratricopeptide (TPR) repeat protein
MKRKIAIMMLSALLLASFTHAACAREPTDWVIQGNKYLDEGNYAKAIQAYDEALAIDPENAAALSKKAYALNELGRNDEALRASSKALAINPENAAAWREKSYALNELGRYDEALRASNMALAINPENTAALYDKGYALYKLGKYNEALQAADKALSIDPDYKNAKNLRSDILDVMPS